ncbi:MAG: hypothetical protein AMXMBFR44_1710 [Candidatus Campbellbacteria bacterium]
MDKNSKLLFIIFLLAILVAIGYTTYKTVFLQDFEVIEETEE